MRGALRLAVQRSIHGKQSQRIARLFGLVDGASFQRHRHRIRLIGAGIVEPAVNQNRDGNQRRLPALRELQQTHGSRSFDLLFGLGFFGKLFFSGLLRAFQLRPALRNRAQRSHHHDEEKPKNDDDGGP
jgi:hypothetical protein